MSKHIHKWIFKESHEHFSATIRVYTCKCGEENQTYQIWGLQEVDM